jgi:tetratricopeptide (TPR) repeat protein
MVCGNDLTNSVADFTTATQSTSLPSEDLAVARFKTGDALLAQKDFANALENYHAVLDDFASFPAVAGTLGDRALYQSLRANLRLTNYDGASKALAQILKQFPASELATGQRAALWREGWWRDEPSGGARTVFQEFCDAISWIHCCARRWNSPLPALTNWKQKWLGAIAGYQGWLEELSNQ